MLVPTFLVSAYFLHTVSGGWFSPKLDEYAPVEFASGKQGWYLINYLKSLNIVFISSANAELGLPKWAHPLTEDERFAKINGRSSNSFLRAIGVG